MFSLLNTSSVLNMGHTVLVPAPVQVTDGSLERISPGKQRSREAGTVSGRAKAAGVGKKVAGAGVMGFVRSGVRPGAAGMLIASRILDYLPTPVTVFISKMCLAPE